MIRIPSIVEIENKALLKGVSLRALCIKADVDPSNVYYWRQGRKPSGRIMDKLIKTLKELK